MCLTTSSTSCLTSSARKIEKRTSWVIHSILILWYIASLLAIEWTWMTALCINIWTITLPRRHTILPTPTHWVEKRLAILLIASKQDCIEYRVSYQLETVHQILIMRLRHGISHNLIVPIELRPQVKHMQLRIGLGHKLPILRKAMFPCSRYPLLRSRCLPSSQ